MSEQTNAIGVFDSGLGGISVLKELRKQMPYENFIYYGDSQFAPYGEKSKEEIRDRCYYICDFLVEKGVKAIVIACNTATSACVEDLRKRYSIPIIGMEPAIKVAADKGENQHIIVMATPFTLRETKFANLMERCCLSHYIVRMPCPELVHIIEEDQFDEKIRIMNQLQSYFHDIHMNEIDSIVLGCTHFVFYQAYIKELIPAHIQIIDGNLGTVRHVMEILQEQNLCNPLMQDGEIQLFNSSESSKVRLAEKLLYQTSNIMNITS